MHIVGNVLKRAIKIGSSLFNGKAEAFACQEEQLKDLLKQAKDTAFGKYYGKSNEETNSQE